jgi:tRNA(Ile)-lysidine synthase
VPAAEEAVSAAEAAALFASLRSAPALLLAVSGGPDSTALMLIAARWRAALAHGPKLFAATIDHRLRPESAAEARAVGKLARSLGIAHEILRWTGKKPAAGLQEAARAARYRLLAGAARAAGAAHILTGHTLDDQAETVLLRMARGSGLTGLGAMLQQTPLAEDRDDESSGQRRNETPLWIVRPLLDLPKARLLATLAAEGIGFADDPSNRDPRFTRARLRQLMPLLAGEGLDARRLALLARRLQRADAAIETVVDAAAAAASQNGGAIRIDAEKFIGLPAEVALRLLGRAIARAAGETPLRLGRLEALYEALMRSSTAPPGQARLRRTLAGALVTLTREALLVERAPPRTRPAKGRRRSLTTRIYGHAPGS